MQIVVLFIFIIIMVHIIAPNPAKRQDLLTSIANDTTKLKIHAAAAKEKLKANNIGENILDPSQKNKEIDKFNHPLLDKLKKK
jgi:hypothetical protein